MPTAIPNRIYVSGNHTAAVAVSLPVFMSPFAGVTADYVFTQDFMCEINSFAPLALNTAHPDYPDYKLASESEKRDAGGGMVRWTRTYAQLPESYSEPGGSYAYNFIGFFSPGLILPVVSRERFTRNVTVRITHDFFLVGAGGTHATFEAIPRTAAQRYYLNATAPNVDIDYLANGGILAGGPTVPSQAQYEALIASDASADSHSIVVEDSTLTRWMGNFFRRETRRIKAQ